MVISKYIYVYTVSIEKWIFQNKKGWTYGIDWLNLISNFFLHNKNIKTLLYKDVNMKLIEFNFKFRFTQQNIKIHVQCI